jgi:glycerol-3-phosphate acyltransferase PlsY
VEGGDGATVLYVLALLMGYAVGCLQLSPWVAGRHGVDLRRVGDGNPGAWNALEHLGARRAAPAFLLDGAKGAAAGLLGLAVTGGWWGGWVGVAGAMIGHAVPLAGRVRGGKSVMCLVGGVAVLAPVAWVGCLVICLVVTASASFAWGARVGVFALPVVVLVTGPRERVVPLVWLMAVVGALFGLDLLRRRRSVRASAGRDGGPTASA